MRHTRNIIAAVLMLFVVTNISATDLSNTNDEQAVKQAVTEYAQSIDKKDLSALEDVLYDNANFIMINKIRNNISQYDKDDLIYQVKKGAMGGWARNLTIIKVDFTDNAAVAKIEITDNKMKTSEYVSLVNFDGKWQIAGSTMSIDKL